MAYRENGVFPMLSTQERIFAKHYARTHDPVASMRAAGHLDENDTRTKAVANQFLANECIMQFIEEEQKRINKNLDYDKEYILDNVAKVIKHCVQTREVPIKGSDKTRTIMNGPAEVIKAVDLIAKVQGIYDPARDTGNKQLAVINVQLNNNVEKRI